MHVRQLFPERCWKKQERQAPSVGPQTEAYGVKNYSAQARPSPGSAGAPVIGGWFAAHMFLCLAGSRALFAPQHVVPLEEIEPTLKVQGTAKLCWEAAGPRRGEVGRVN